MNHTRWYMDEQGGFAVGLTEGWEAEPDAEQGGVDLWHTDGAGELHLIGFPLPPGELPDPGEELFAFLAESEVELEEDEVEDVALESGAELALCEYLSEDEETGETDFWMVGVATLPGALVFAHYSCAAGEEDRERERVRALLTTLRPPDRSGAGPGKRPPG